MQVETDKNLYILLGEIKAQLADMKEAQRKVEERQARMEKRINMAAGAVAFAIFLFQFVWAYITKKVT